MFDFRRLSLGRIVLLSLLMGGGLAAARAADQEKSESRAEKILKARGIDPALVGAFSGKAHFPVGPNLLDISVNGEMKGSFPVIINPEGNVCFTAELFSQLGLKQPANMTDTDGDCFNWAQRQPDISIKAQPEILAVSIAVPESQLLTGDVRLSAERGGFGALLNYNYFSSVIQFAGGQSRSSYLMLDDGINIANWIIRGRQQVSETEGDIQFTRGDLYAERALSHWKKRLLLGQTGVINTLFILGEMRGVQIIPDEGFTRDGAEQGVVEGIASTSQARVEVRQYNTLIYSTLVPAGPFRLNHIPLNNVNSDLDVTIVETNGEVQHFSVPASRMAGSPQEEGQGFSLAAGKLDSSSSPQAGVPAILTLNQNWHPVSGLSLQTGGLLSKKYQSVAASVSARFLQGSELAAMIVAANDKYNHVRSMQLTLSGSYSLTPDVVFSASLSKYTPGFRSISAASWRRMDLNGNDKLYYHLSASWRTPWLGYLTYSHSESTRFVNSAKTSRYDMLSWNFALQPVALTVSFSRSGGSSHNKQMSASLSFPLGQKRVSNYYRHSTYSSQAGSRLDGDISPNTSYSLSADSDFSQQAQSIEAGVSTRMHYTNLSLSATRSSDHSGNYSVSGNGSIGMVGRHLLFSPQAVGKTFGMVALSEKLPGVAIASPGGISWTDWRGQALVPDIPPWQPADLDLNTESLPKQSDVRNGHRSVTLAPGSVKRIDYSLLTSHRAMLMLRLADGRLLPRGGLVRDDKGNILTMVLDDGMVYLEDAPHERVLHIDIRGEKRQCQFTYKPAAGLSEQRPLEEVSGVCLSSSAPDAGAKER